MFIKNGNGLRMIIVLIDAEVSNKRIVATATDVLGLISCLGVADSGFPLLIVIGRSSWPCIETVFVDRNMTVIFDHPPFEFLRCTSLPQYLSYPRLLYPAPSHIPRCCVNFSRCVINIDIGRNLDTTSATAIT